MSRLVADEVVRTATHEIVYRTDPIDGRRRMIAKRSIPPADTDVKTGMAERRAQRDTRTRQRIT